MNGTNPAPARAMPYPPGVDRKQAEFQLITIMRHFNAQNTLEMFTDTPKSAHFETMPEKPCF